MLVSRVLAAQPGLETKTIEYALAVLIGRRFIEAHDAHGPSREARYKLTRRGTELVARLSHGSLCSCS